MSRSRTSVQSIRVVPDEAPKPLSIDELQKFGNERVTELRREVFAALRLSVNDRYFDRSFTVARLRLMQRQAQDAAEAWQRVASIAAEIGDHVRRAEGAHR